MKHLIGFYIYTLICLGFSNSLQATSYEASTTTNTCQENDYIALRALYLSTDGDNWTNKTGWYNAAFFTNHPTLPAGTDMSTWYGVTFDENGCVTCLDMRANSTCTDGYDISIPGNNMVGNLPPEIGNLTALTKLFLHNNQLSGNIPPELGNLTNLEELHLHSNEFTGEIPDELGNLTQLTYLGLGRNELTGTISGLVDLTKLVTLDLRANNLSGSIPVELGSLENLRYISLFNNQLTDDIPPQLGDLDLIVLWLSNNQLTGTIPPELGNITSLTDLWLYGNQLTGNIPSELGNLNELYHLTMGNNQISGNIPPELGSLSNLRTLSLRDNQLTGNIPPELGNLSKLEYLSLNNNQLTGRIPSELSNLTNVYSMVLQDNQMSGCYYADLYVFCTQLTATVNAVDGISNGNNFDVSWQSFCAEQEGVCRITDSDTPVLTDDIRVFPIPAKDFVYFETNDISTTATVILYDVNGKRINAQTLSADKSINISELNHGVYFYELLYEGKVYQGKIIK